MFILLIRQEQSFHLFDEQKDGLILIFLEDIPTKLDYI